MKKIDQKITNYKVITNENTASVLDKVFPIETMHEEVSRPELLYGSTYKIKTPSSEHALYITINDYILNEGTEHEKRLPYEIFINSKNMEHFQWVIALTRIMSAVFRKGGNVVFLVEELRSVFDPKGGYFKKGGKFMPSLVAEIGHIVETHLIRIGVIVIQEDARQKEYINEKKKILKINNTSEGYPEQASLCSKCHTKAVILMDGCMTCLNCADSKCN